MKPKLLIVFVGLLLNGALFAAELTVHAAASLTDAVKEIGGAYEKTSGDKLVFNFGASNLLARQIEQAAPADLFFSADETKMDELERKSLVLSGTRRSLLSNLLVIIVPADATTIPKSAADLTRADYGRIAVAEPQSVPAGIYARQYFEKLGLWSTLKEKIVPTENVRAALAAVESGNVEAGLVYKTDSLLSKKVKVAVEISGAEGPKISYPIAVMKSSKAPEQAKKFADYLAGPEARLVFEKFGFIAATK